MKIDSLPDFAKPYKKKGYDVRLSGSRYQLFKIQSVREPGYKYPRLKQEYIGTIDPEKGLIEKKARPQPKPEVMVEYGLSNFIIRHFKRSLMRSLYNDKAKAWPMVCMAIVHYLYGHVEERFVRLTYIQNYEFSLVSEPGVLKRIEKTADRIDSFMKELVPDGADRDYLKQRLRDIKVSLTAKSPSIQYPEDVMLLFSKYRIKP